MAKKDYPELEGKEVLVDTGEGIKTGIVVGCNYDIGISIINKEDKQDYLLCGSGPGAPNYISDLTDKEIKAEKAIFYSHVRLIKKGFIPANSIDRIYAFTNTNGINSNPTADSCPFGQ